MALGKLVGEFKGKVTSVKVQPFDGSGQGVRQEVYLTAELSGRIPGTEVATVYATTAPDGTGTSRAYGIITTSDGEAITVEAFGIGSPPTSNGSKFRGIAYLRTNSQKYSWVNTTPMAYEGELNTAQTEASATLCEWK
jgi:hypothetical protein